MNDNLLPLSDTRIIDPIDLVIHNGCIHPLSLQKEYRPLLEHIFKNDELMIPKKNRDDLKFFIQHCMNPGRCPI